MTNQEYAFVEGFTKRASEYGYDELEAYTLLKQSTNFFGNLGGKVDTKINNFTEGAGHLWQDTKNIANKAQHMITDPVIKQYHQAVDPWAAGYEAFKNKYNEPYKPGPNEYDFIGPSQRYAPVQPQTAPISAAPVQTAPTPQPAAPGTQPAPQISYQPPAPAPAPASAPAPAVRPQLKTQGVA